MLSKGFFRGLRPVAYMYDVVCGILVPGHQRMSQKGHEYPFRNLGVV